MRLCDISMNQESYLVGDIGGTNVRFALAKSDTPDLGNIRTYECANYATTEDALAEYLKDTKAALPDAFCLAAAGPVVGEEVTVTNSHWHISATAIAERFKVKRVRLLNDFEAIAWCIPELGVDDRMRIGIPDAPSLAKRPFSVAVVGPGTGFGVAGLISDGTSLVPVVGEGGHVGFAPRTELQNRILAILQQRFEVVSLERLVSGEGLRNLYSALAEMEGRKVAVHSASEIFAASINGEPVAVSATQMFFDLFGQFAGDVALAFGAFDGVYIAGGICRRYPHMLSDGRFRSGFEPKGKLRNLMQRTPTTLILSDEPGLLGAAACLRRLA